MPRTINFRGTIYRSIKHPILEYIFAQKTANYSQGIGDDHTFTLKDVSEAMDVLYSELGYKPTSHSNFVLDLTRKDAGIQARLPQVLIDLGYDLKKKTGVAPNGQNYAGVFVYVGIGNELGTWLKWPETPAREYVIPNNVPSKIMPYLSNDEGALFIKNGIQIAIFNWDSGQLSLHHYLRVTFSPPITAWFRKKRA